MKREEIEALVTDWVEAWKRRDPDALTASYTEDGVYTSMLAGTIQGRRAIESLYRSWFAAFPEMVFEVERQVIEGESAAILWSQRGRHQGDFCGLPGTGRSFMIHGVFFMTFQTGKIASMRSIYDFTGLLIQVGVLKAKPAV
jgi:steroid delta-isomerase-like uncharacterized protein